MTRIFVHEPLPGSLPAALLERSTGDERYLQGIGRYPERALLLARPEDIVCISDPVDPDYLPFLAELGLGVDPSRIVVAEAYSPPASAKSLKEKLIACPDALRRIARLAGPDDEVALCPFIGSRLEFDLAERLSSVIGRKVSVRGGPPEVVELAGQKDQMRAVALHLGVPVAEGVVVKLEVDEQGTPADVGALAAAIDRFIGTTGRVIVRGARGGGGSGTLVVEDRPESRREVLQAVGSRRDNRVYVVETMVDAVVSPNVQMEIDPESGKIRCLGITDQLLDQTPAHRGNTFPSQSSAYDETLRLSHRLSEWLRGAGCVGPIGFDFVEYSDSRTGQPRPLFAEVNPRVNSAFYPLEIMKRLNGPEGSGCFGRIEAFLAIKGVPSPASCFREVRVALEQNRLGPSRHRVIVPYNFGSFRRSSVGLYCFGRSRQEVREDLERAKRALAHPGGQVTPPIP